MVPRRPILVGLIVLAAIAMAAAAAFVVVRAPPSSSPSPSRAATQTPAPTATPLAAGTRSVFRATATESPLDAGAMEAVVMNLRERFRRSGLSDARISARGADRVVVDARTSVEAETVRELAETFGRVAFVPIPDPRRQPAEGELIDPALPELLGGDVFERVSVGVDEAGRAALDFQLRPEAAAIFETYTEEHVGEGFAIVLDGRVLSAPVIRTVIAGGEGRISSVLGGFDPARLAAIIQAGELPLELRREEVTPIRPETSGPSSA